MTEKQKILIVDDRKENLVALRQVLSAVDAEIVEATTGNQALAATLDHRFAVAILDVQMPGMSGYELAEHLRGDKNIQMFPIVFLTAAHADEQHIFKSYEAGGVDYITKPYVPEILRGKVNVFLEMARNKRELEMHRDRLETLVAERTAKLDRLLKELKCLYAISSIVAEADKTIDETLKAAVDLIPPGWQYPEITCARIRYAKLKFTSPGYRDTPWKLKAKITVSGAKDGAIEVCYLEERPALDQGPFLKEERDLIAEIARQLGDMMARKHSQKALRLSNKRFYHLMTNLNDVVWTSSANGSNLLDISIAFERVYGRPMAEFRANPGLWLDVVHPEDRHIAEASGRELFETGKATSEYRIINPDGDVRWLLDRKSMVYDEKGNPVQMGGVASDITERKQAEEQLRASLKEKEVLLREIHHRVKNNLQIISGLLTLQADQTGGKSLDEIFRKSQDRIRSMALIHEKLYSSHNLAEIAFDDYLRTLAENLFASQDIVPSRITTIFDTEPILITIEKAIPLGLIVNEIISNSLKHAFPDGRQGEIRIGLHGYKDAKSYSLKTESGTLHCTPSCELIVADNGVGLPAGQVAEMEKTLGMKLVSMLAKQIQAELEVKSGPGAEFRLIFPGLPAHETVKDSNHGG
ncbi:MAG: response regulator [Candidatus Aminicenantes bacterium]|nr:response regulator [Candidatus Aminicenantes bacterium]